MAGTRRDFSKNELVALLGAQANRSGGNARSAGVGFNTAELVAGQVFFALKGAKVHGHKFVPEAIAKGASFVVVEDPAFLNDPKIADQVLVVPDSLAALHTLSTLIRADFKGKVLGVIGSVGKTTTKDIIASLAKSFIRCSNSIKSFNTNIGIPYTICNADLGAQLWVLELGMNHPGELKELSELVKPDALLVTQIAPEHMEFFKTIEDVADAEFESLAGLAPDGDVFICAEDSTAISGFKRNAARYSSSAKMSLFGARTGCQVQYRDFSHSLENLLEGHFTLSLGGQDVKVRTQLIGAHNAQNFAGAALALTTLCPTIKLSELPEVIKNLGPSPMRLNQFRISAGPLVIDDTYNSSPEAVRRALDILRELSRQGLKLGLVLGEMRELGEQSLQYHLELAPDIRSCKPVFLVGVGECAAKLADQLSGDCEAIGLQSAAEAISVTTRQLSKVDVLLLKGSRSVGLDVVAQSIR